MDASCAGRATSCVTVTDIIVDGVAWQLIWGVQFSLLCVYRMALPLHFWFISRAEPVRCSSTTASLATACRPREVPWWKSYHIDVPMTDDEVLRCLFKQQACG